MRSVDLELLDATLEARGEPAYRAAQVWSWAARGGRASRRDTVHQARALARLLGPKGVQGQPDSLQPDWLYDGSSREAIGAFREALVEGGVPSTVGLTRGRDIGAACGQLAAAR